MELTAGLYIVSTPIGNLEDITLRALFVLKNCNLIYCEDTRSTRKLLLKHGIMDKKLAVYNDHSDEYARNKIVEYIASGKIAALVSDAGTPLISDPGFKLVRTLQDQNLHIDVIPGACAAISALVLSGLPTDKFYFAGFMPKTKPAREKLLASLTDIPATLIFYDAPSRVLDSLSAIQNVLGNREVAVTREITKIFQQVIRKPVSEMIEKFDEIKTKGEFVLLISPEKQDSQISQEDVENLIHKLYAGGLSKKNIAEKIINKLGTKFKKNEIYKICDKILDN